MPKIVKMLGNFEYKDNARINLSELKKSGALPNFEEIIFQKDRARMVDVEFEEIFD